MLLIAGMAGLGLAGYPAPQATRDGLNLLAFLIVVAVLPMILAFAMHQQRVTAATLKHRANIDPLTGLANRNAFEERVRAELAEPSAAADGAGLPGPGPLQADQRHRQPRGRRRGDPRHRRRHRGPPPPRRPAGAHRRRRIRAAAAQLLADGGRGPRARHAARHRRLPLRLGRPDAGQHRQRRPGGLPAGPGRVRAAAVAGRRRLLHRQGTGRQPRLPGQPGRRRDARPHLGHALGGAHPRGAGTPRDGAALPEHRAAARQRRPRPPLRSAGAPARPAHRPADDARRIHARGRALPPGHAHRPRSDRADAGLAGGQPAGRRRRCPPAASTCRATR